MSNMSATRGDVAARTVNTVKASLWALIHAELERAARTRSTIAFLSTAAAITLAIFTVRLSIARGSEGPVSSDLIVVSADVVGLVVMLNSALAVARDHQSGAIELVRVLIPTRGRQLLALGAAHAVLAVAVVLVVTIVGTAVILTAEPSALAGGGLVDAFARLLLTSVLLVFAGVGVGTLCRSSAATMFVVLALYLLLPVALMVAGFAGQAWASAVSDMTLGLLASGAISGASDAWQATAGVAVWAVGLAALGVLRETKGK